MEGEEGEEREKGRGECHYNDIMTTHCIMES